MKFQYLLFVYTCSLCGTLAPKSCWQMNHIYRYLRSYLLAEGLYLKLNFSLSGVNAGTFVIEDTLALIQGL